MKTYTIMIDSILAAKAFVNIVNTCDFDIDLESGRYIVDAKSIMGIFSLDLSKPIKMNVYTDEVTEFEKLVKQSDKNHFCFASHVLMSTPAIPASST